MKTAVYPKSLKLAFGALLLFNAYLWVLLFNESGIAGKWSAIAGLAAISVLLLLLAFFYGREKKALALESATQQQAQQQKAESAKSLIEQIARGEIIAADDSREQQDDLSRSIFNLQEQLTEYRSKEEKRNWSANGLARFAELLRSGDGNTKEFSAHLISEIVKYTGANQGAIFIKGHDNQNREEYLELSGAYAFDRRKYLNKRIEKGEGLLGQCLLEQDDVYITQVPEDYMSIKSGLGQALPRNVVIVPLVSNENMLGAIEIASFKILEDYKIQFLRDLAGSIASTFSMIEGNEATRALLSESQGMAEELKASEEEMRQNMEELTATQEEMSRKQLELDGVILAIDKSMLKAEFGVDGHLLSANHHFLTTLGWKESDINQKKHSDLISNEALQLSIWKEVSAGQNLSREFKTLNSRQQSCWLSTTYSPVYNTAGNLWKVILIGQDITERVKKEQEHERLSLVADNTDNAVIITNAEGLTEYVNPGFTKISGYTLAEMAGKKPGALLQGPETNKETIKRLREKISRQEPVYEEILNYHKNGQTYWISMVINPVKNEQGIVDKFISVQANITGTKESALDAKYKLEAIGRSNAVLEMDTSGNILEANEHFLQMLHYDKESLIGLHHTVFAPLEKQNDVAYPPLWQELLEGKYVSTELYCIAKDGAEKVLRAKLNPIFDINGKLQKIIQFATDITEERRLHLENKKQEVELRHYMESINNTIASLTFDDKGIITDANDIYMSVTGFRLDEIKGKSYFDLLPESERSKPQAQLMWDSLKEGRFFSGEFKQIDKKGHTIWSTGTINPIYDIEQKVKKVILLAQFTTKEKEKMQELSNTVNALKGIIPILELNPDFSAKSAHKLFMEQSGYTRMSLKDFDFEKSCQLPEGLSKELIMDRLKQQEVVDAKINFSCGLVKDFRAHVIFAAVFNLDNKIDKILLLFTSMISTEMEKTK